ncbi:MaoC family dehydratase N-terminal domain-containing protein [Salininema proteolyticum]|uniref:MaoC family dehydratase N-terminal domain-containing protein n=1 Tax=Salininema proteolyticum TaxID=1607685 RepID=A0ABV8U2L3_9ACTN
MEIAPEAVSAFTRSLGLADTSSVPPTFLVSLTLPDFGRFVRDPELGLDFAKVLHREQTFRFHRQPRVGDVVTCTPRIESIKTVAGNDLLTAVTRVATSEGEPIADVTMVLFVGGDES